MERLAYLSKAQRLALDKQRALIGAKQIDYIVDQGPEVLNARLEAFMQFEATFPWPYGVGYTDSLHPYAR